MKEPLDAECSEIWERGCFNELAGLVWDSGSVCEGSAAGAARADAGNEKGNGHIPETGDTQQPTSVVP